MAPADPGHARPQSQPTTNAGVPFQPVQILLILIEFLLNNSADYGKFHLFVERFHFHTHVKCYFLENLVFLSFENETLAYFLFSDLLIDVCLVQFLVLLTEPHESYFPL